MRNVTRSRNFRAAQEYMRGAAVPHRWLLASAEARPAPFPLSFIRKETKAVKNMEACSLGRSLYGREFFRSAGL